MNLNFYMLRCLTIYFNKKIKKILVVLFISVISFSIGHNVKAVSERYDVNQDGGINTVDSLLILRNSLGLNMLNTA